VHEALLISHRNLNLKKINFALLVILDLGIIYENTIDQEKQNYTKR